MKKDTFKLINLSVYNIEGFRNSSQLNSKYGKIVILLVNG